MTSTGQPRVAGPLPARLLVIGYGNTLFGDDGLGPMIAEHVADWHIPGVVALSRHELTPELAADIAATHTVVFVDAAPDATDVMFKPIEAETNQHESLDHALTPGSLLSLTRTAFGHCPAEAMQLLVPARDFTLGGSLSAEGRIGLAQALRGIANRL